MASSESIWCSLGCFNTFTGSRGVGRCDRSDIWSVGLFRCGDFCVSNDQRGSHRFSRATSKNLQNWIIIFVFCHFAYLGQGCRGSKQTSFSRAVAFRTRGCLRPDWVWSPSSMFWIVPAASPSWTWIEYLQQEACKRPQLLSTEWPPSPCKGSSFQTCIRNITIPSTSTGLGTCPRPD